MRVEWGNKNESILISATGNGTNLTDDKLFLSILHKQVCDRHILQRRADQQILAAQSVMYKRQAELSALKAKTLWAWIRRHIF